MEPGPRPPPTALFTVRLWQEVVDIDRSEWRGEVKQIASGETHYFRDWQTLIDHIAQMLTSQPTQAATGRAAIQQHADPPASTEDPT